MSRSFRLHLPAALFGALSLSACAPASERTAEPVTTSATSTANPEFVRQPSWATGLRWATPRTAPVQVVRTIGAEGGRLELPATGLVLTVPAGAVARPTRFAVSAVPGALVAYDFRPHGARFARPLVIQQGLRGTTGLPADGAVLEGGSFSDLTQLDQAAGVAQVEEYAPATLVAGASAVRVEVAHFSGWLLTTARR